tara:strand:+ start:3762 stop:4583 length:822 start_codon:yes stop_codon:yes gene_type:complete
MSFNIDDIIQSRVDEILQKDNSESEDSQTFDIFDNNDDDDDDDKENEYHNNNADTDDNDNDDDNDDIANNYNNSDYNEISNKVINKPDAVPNIIENNPVEKVNIANNKDLSISALDFEKLINLNKEQADRISRLENHQLVLKSEIDHMKSKRHTFEYRDKLADSTCESDDEDSIESKNSTFNYIPSIVKRKKAIIPTFCGRTIQNYRRYIEDKCQDPGCIRCHLDNLVGASYQIEKLQAVRQALVKLMDKKSEPRQNCSGDSTNYFIYGLFNK